MKGVNEKDQIFDIGSKVFPLDDIISQEEYLVQIVIPEIDNPNQIAAYINATIVLYMSDFKYYESLRRKQEKRLKKYMAAAKKASEYLQYVREIYGDLTQMKPELIVDFNNEKLMQRKGAKLNVNFNNTMEAEEPGSNYLVEFNNEKEIQTRGIPLRVEFNNSKEVLTPITETETKKYEYKYNVTNNVNLSKINELERKIQLLEKEKERINNNLANLPISPKTNLEQINIKKITETVKYVNNQKDISQQDLNTNIPLHNEVASPKELFSNEQIIKEEINTSQTVPISVPQANANSQIIKTTTTEKKTENISSPKNILNNPPSDQNNQFGVNSYLKQTTTQTKYQTQGENQNILSSQTDNLGSGGYVHEQTTKTTETTTKTPIYLQGKNINQIEGQNILHTVNGNAQDFLNNFLSGENTTTTTTTTTTNQYGSGETDGTIGYGTNYNGEVNEYQATLEPIVNQVLVNKSVKKAIIDQTTNKTLFSEKTLPVSYLPEKVNEVIYEDKVTTLPVITANVNSSYNALQPIVHDLKTYYANETATGANGYNFVDSTNTNVVSGNYNTEYNFTSNGNNNYAGGFEINGTDNSNVNFGEYAHTDYGNSNGSNWGTTQTTETVTTTQYNTGYDIPMQDNNYLPSQQVQYGV